MPLVIPSLALVAAALASPQDGTHGKPPEQRSTEARDELVLEVRRQLRSDDARTIASGAHRVAEHRLAACEEDLCKALRGFATDDPDPCQYAATVVLDALVRIAGDVPLAELEPFFALEPTVALMLPRDYEPSVLVRLLRAQRQGSPSWRAVGNTLVTMRNADLVADVLTAPIVPWVHVHDGELPIDWYPPCSIGCSLDVAHEDWPPFPRHDFRFLPSTGARVLIGGAFPVFSTRWPNGSAGRCSSTDDNTLPEARAQWLSWLLGKEHTETVLAIDRMRSLRWRGAESYPDAVAALRETIANDWRTAVAACVAAKLITAESAKALAPDIVLGPWNLHDARKNRSTKLPELTTLPEPR